MKSQPVSLMCRKDRDVSRSFLVFLLNWTINVSSVKETRSLNDLSTWLLLPKEEVVDLFSYECP